MASLAAAKGDGRRGHALRLGEPQRGQVGREDHVREDVANVAQPYAAECDSTCQRARGAMDYNTSRIILPPGRNRQAAKKELAQAEFLGQLERHVLLWVLDQAPSFTITVGGLKGIRTSCAISESTWVRLRKKLEDKGILKQIRKLDAHGVSHWDLVFNFESLWGGHA